MNKAPYGQAAGFKGPQVPFPHGWAAGEGRYNTHFTKAQCQNSTFSKTYGIISLTNKNNPLIFLFIFFKKRR